jgi:hypothetical protein
MNFLFERVTEPSIEPVTLAEMKRHLRAFMSVTDDDDDITNLIVAAREWVEDYTGRALIDQTWRLSLVNRSGYSVGGDRVSGYTPGLRGWWGQRDWDHWMRSGEIMLRKAPVIALTEFVSVDQASVETAVDPLSYELREPDSKWPRVVPLNGITWPTSGVFAGFRITFRAGFCDLTGSPKEDATVVPVRFKQAMKLWAEANYDRDPVMMPLLLNVAEQIVKPERADLSIA